MSTDTAALFAERLKVLALALGEAAPEESVSAIRRRSGTERVPLTYQQQRLWFLDQFAPAGSAYHVPLLARLEGALDDAALERALAEIIHRHEVLRTAFPATDGVPEQVILPPGGFVLERADLRAFSAEARAEALRVRLADEVARPFDLAAGPPFRAALLRLGEAEYVLAAVMHHIVTDAWSLRVLSRELAALYEACRDGRASPLHDLPFQYADFALWQREQLSEAALRSHLDWWLRRLAGAPAAVDLPTDRPRPPVQSFRGGSVDFELPPGLVAALARAEGATLFMVLLAAWQALLCRYTGEDDVVVGSPVAGRLRAELEPLIGFFVNLLPLRGDCTGDPSFRELVGRARSATLEAHEHQELPFESIVDGLGLPRDPARAPLFQTLLAVQGAPSPEPRLGDLRLRAVETPWSTAKYDLLLAVAEEDGRLRCTLEFAADLFDRATAERIAGHLRVLLEGAAADPDRRLSALPLLGAEERARVVDAWNRTHAAHPLERGIEALFAEQARRTPHADAVVFEGVAQSYRALDEGANRLAHHLRAAGVREEVRVAVHMERSGELVVVLLAILKAGGAYVPLDPDYPPERIAYMLQDSGASVVVTRDGLPAALASAGVRVIALEGEAEEIGRHPPTPPPAERAPNALVYVIYTSGSTGRPKGAMNTSAGVVNRLCWMQRRYGLGAGDRVLQKTPFSFDVSVWELFWPLITGATLVVARPGGHRDPRYLAEVIGTARITTLHFVPSMLRAFLEDAPPEGLEPLRRVICSGEELTADLQDRFFAWMPAGVELHNLYGPTEAAVDVTHWTCAPGGEGRRVPIGRPVDNTRVLVLDARGGPVPVGVPGELHIAGIQVARGYGGRPGLTAERFVPDAFGGEPGARMYRTGDRVRWTDGGVLEYLGRLDEQVKLRGFRVEPGEIEAALLGHPCVRECAVVVRDDPAGERRLVAYVAGKETDTGALDAHLRTLLPEHMVPSTFVPLPALPLTPSGKVDRRALPAPDWRARLRGGMPPRTPAEELVAGMFAEVLRIDRPGAEDDFFALGGHSLLAVQVASHVRRVFGVDLPLAAFFATPTVAGIAREVERRGGGAPEGPPRIERAADRAGAVPLSFQQRSLWLAEQLAPGGSAYAMPLLLRLRGALDTAALRRALAELVRRHEALRTVFPADERGEPRQVVLAAAESFPLPVDEGEGEAWVGARAREAAREPFDLAAGPLLRATLLRLGVEDQALLVCMHHVVSDEWSLGVLAAELGALYAAFAQGKPSPLPELPVQYADFALWQRERLSADVLEGQLAYWRERMRGAPPALRLPAARPVGSGASRDGAVHAFAAVAAVVDALRALGRRQGSTLFMTLLAAWQLFLSRYSGERDVVVGVPVAGRVRPEVEPLIGYFVNLLPFRADHSADPPFTALLAQARQATLAAHQHAEVPFDRLAEELQAGRAAGRGSLFRVVFSYHGAPAAGPVRLPGLEVEVEEVPTGTAKFDLTLHVFPDGERPAFALEYAAAVFDRETIERMAGHFTVLLGGIAADPDRCASRLPIVSAEERAWLLAAPNGGARDVPPGPLVHERVVAHAARSRDAPALTHGGESMDYGTLERVSSHLAQRLRACGVRRGSRVGICLERSPQTVVAMLAVLRAGGAYVPLDPANPAERLAFVLRDAGIAQLVADAPLLEARPALAEAVRAAGVRVIGIEDEDDDAASAAEAAPVRLDGDDAAYVIYTSGSTGVPKGVEVTHGNVARLLDATCAWFGFGPSDVWAFFHSAAFDFSVWEIWGALCHGGRLVVVPHATARSPEAFHALVRREGVTVLNQTPSAFRQFVQAAEGAPSGEPLALRWVVFGGETLDAATVRRWFSLHGEQSPRLVNMYGITETTVHVTYCELDKEVLAVAAHGTTPVGVPIPDLRIYLLDAAMEPVPPGVAGEIHVGGAGVARGYLGRPGLTASRFVPDPFSGRPGARLYRSGDLGRMRAGGTLEYAGRADDQVKVRGFRIEPGEVEAALAAHPAVRGCAVVAREDAGGARRLVAYVAADGAPPSAAALRAHLQARLPEHMIPAAFVALEALPLTSSGKVDRRALPADGGDAGEGELLGTPYEPPATAVEQLLQQVWAEVLGLARVGAGDDFFAAGGDSLRAVQLVAALRERGVSFAVQDLFERPGLRALAARIAEAGGGPAPVPHHLAEIDPDDRAELSARFGAAMEDAYPAAAMQALMIREYARDVERAGIYHPQQGFRLRDPALSVDALRHAIRQVVRRHPALRTVFARGRAGGLLQVVLRDPEVPVACADLRAETDAGRARLQAEWIAHDLATPFVATDPSSPLVRFAVLHHADDEAFLLISAHHAVEDGWGNAHFLATLLEAYAQARDGGPVAAEPSPGRYREFVALEAEVRSSAEARAFWHTRMREMPAAWPVPSPKEGTEPPRECRATREVPPAVAAALRAHAARERVALKAVYLLPFLDVAAELAQTERVCAGVVSNGRSERLTEPLTTLGLFWNLLPVARPPGPAALRTLHRDLLEADRFGRYPLSDLVEPGAREPFFATFNFLYFHHLSGFGQGLGVTVEPVHELDRLHLPFNVAVSIPPRGEGALVHLEHDGRYVTRARAAAALDEYLHKLEEMAWPD